MFLKQITVLLALLALFWGSTHAAPLLAISALTNRVLIIDQSSTAVSGGKATLSIGPLQRTAEIYVGDYEIKVSPYFFKNEKGKLSILVSDDSFTQALSGRAVEITGTATTSGSGETRRIDAIATPLANDRGTLKLWFFAGDRKMVFESAYRLAEKATASIHSTAPNYLEMKTLK